VQLYVLAQALDVEPAELLPKRSEVLPSEKPKVEELLENSSPNVVEFLTRVRDQVSKKGGQRA
jgi:hypothetical protein